MSLKETILAYMKNAEILAIYRLSVAKGSFIFFAFLFFSNYLFVGANFYFDIFIRTLPYVYILFLVSIFLLVYLYISQYMLKMPAIVRFSLAFILFIVLVIFSLPFVVPKGMLIF